MTSTDSTEGTAGADIAGEQNEPEAAAGEVLVRRFWDEVINRHDPEAADQLMAADYRQHAAGIDHGPEGFKTFFRDVLATSEGMRAEVLKVLVADDLVVSSTRLDFDRPPPDWNASQVIVDVFRTDGDKLTEHWDLPL